MKRWIWFAILIICSCTTHQPINGLAVDEMNATLLTAADKNMRLDAKGRHRALPSDISNALMPKMYHPYQKPHQQRFDIAVENVPAKTFFMGLVKGTSYNMVVSPDVTGNITLTLSQVTIPQVLQTLEDVYGYAYKQTPAGFQILSNQLKTKVYAVNYLELERKGRSFMQISSGQVSQANQNNTQGNNLNSGSTSGNNNNQNAQQTSSIGDVESKSTINFWKEMQKSLENIIGKDKGRSVTVNPLAGVVVVRAYPVELKDVEAYLDSVQNNMDRQVMLEAKILEIQLNHQYEAGIDWKIFGASLNALSNFPFVSITDSKFPSAYTTEINWNRNFTQTIRALSEQGNVQVLSSPRISTMNNQKAVIKVGSDEFFVTNVSTAVTSTVNSTTPTQDVQLTPFFSGITLDVTPQIDTSGNVTLHIHPSVSQVVDQQKEVDLGTDQKLVLPVAKSTVRESDTVVHARDSEVIVIGGLMQNSSDEALAGLPFVTNMPFLGSLFRHTKQTSKKSELVILLKPTVIKRRVWSKAITNAQQRIVGLKRGMHFGDRPDVFGTEGERPIKYGPVSGIYKTPKKRCCGE